MTGMLDRSWVPTIVQSFGAGILVPGRAIFLEQAKALKVSNQRSSTMRAISAAILLTAALAAADAEADPRVLSLCLSTGGSLMNGLQVLPSELDDRKNRRHANGQRLSWSCQADQTEVLVEVVGVFPRTARAVQLGLVPRGSAPILIEDTIPNGSNLRSLFLAPAPARNNVHIILDLALPSDNTTGGQPPGCAIWFTTLPDGDTPPPDGLDFLNFNGLVSATSYEDHNNEPGVRGFIDVALVVGPAPDGNARIAPEPIRFGLPDGTIVHLENAQVFYNAGDHDGCYGSVEVSFE
jgi:hypothetical protein